MELISEFDTAYKNTGQSGGIKSLRVIDISGGMDYSRIFLLNNYTHSESNFKPGFIIGIGIINLSSKNFAFSGNLNFLSCNTFIKFKENSSIYLTKTERFKWIDIPIYLKYYFVKYKISPNIFIGISMDYLISSKFNLTRQIYNENQNIVYSTSMIHSLNVLDQRRKLNTSVITGFGIEYPLSEFIGYINIEYRTGIFSMVDSKSTLSGDYLEPVFQYQDNDFTLNRINIILGIKIPLAK